MSPTHTCKSSMCTFSRTAEADTATNKRTTNGDTDSWESVCTLQNVVGATAFCHDAAIGGVAHAKGREARARDVHSGDELHPGHALKRRIHVEHGEYRGVLRDGEKGNGGTGASPTALSSRKG